MIEGLISYSKYKSKRASGLGYISYGYRTLLYNESVSTTNPFGHIIYKKAPLSITSISSKLSRISRKINTILLSNYHSYCNWYK